MVRRVELRQSKKLVVRAKLAVGDESRQTQFLKEGVETNTRNVKCLEFAGGPDNLDGSPTKAFSRGTQKGRVVVIAGPTAVGKSRIAIALAKQLGGEIISADSIQVYKGMNVGSAKTPLIERQGVPHHLLDMVCPTEEYSASRFLEDARAATDRVLDRGRVPIIVGGTCTYLRWFMNGNAGAPKATSEVGATIDGDIRRLIGRPGSWETAVHRLAQAGDLTTTNSLARNPTNANMLRRAIEVVTPWGAFHNLYTCMLNHMDGSEWDYDYDFQCYFLYQHRAELYHWIDLRCEQMLADPRGLLQEASWLLDLGLMPDSSSASRGIGYQEAMEFLMECRKAGGMATEKRVLEFLSAFQHVSRSLVKKQLTWFRSDQHSDVKQFHWIDASQSTEKILEAMRKEYWRPPGYPSELRGSDDRKHASYKEGKVLKYYKVENRIFTNSAAIANVLKWVKQTQVDRRFQQNVVRF
nr:tRNA dimethylallyltransferase 9-like isoform X3 [Physcomitrium patens]|eukprot:XP_024377380.1 tRNA dimethylallyltransferase 9-like isoform X3 [Physcomitrella patens]